MLHISHKEQRTNYYVRQIVNTHAENRSLYSIQQSNVVNWPGTAMSQDTISRMPGLGTKVVPKKEQNLIQLILGARQQKSLTTLPKFWDESVWPLWDAHIWAYKNAKQTDGYNSYCTTGHQWWLFCQRAPIWVLQRYFWDSYIQSLFTHSWAQD